MFKDKKSETPKDIILHTQSGLVQSGRMLAIMGSSGILEKNFFNTYIYTYIKGAGKSTLLSALSMRL